MPYYSPISIAEPACKSFFHRLLAGYWQRPLLAGGKQGLCSECRKHCDSFVHILETSFIPPGHEFTTLMMESVSPFLSGSEDEDEDVKMIMKKPVT